MTGPAGAAGGDTGPVIPEAIARLADEPPPFWGRWDRIYLLIAGLLAVETAAFWWLARWAS
jgi:hypothetical protein